MDIHSRSNGACVHAGSLSLGSSDRLYTAAEVRKLTNDLEVLNAVLNWVDSFLARPHSQLGRAGKVCPFVPEALSRSALKLTIVRLANDAKNDPSELERITLLVRDRFLEGEDADASANIYRSLILIFPDVSQEEAPLLIDGVQKKLKAEFVKDGLMLGEFHPLNNASGLRNPEFRPLRSPIPLLAIRHMVESDIDFLNRPNDPPSQRIPFLTAYLNFIGSSLSPTNHSRATVALKIAQDELASSRPSS